LSLQKSYCRLVKGRPLYSPKSGGTGKVAAGFQRISEKLALKGFTIGFFSYAGFNT
jgi:hypothetical protein